MQSIFERDFLKIYTAFKMPTRGKWKMDLFSNRLRFNFKNRLSWTTIPFILKTSGRSCVRKWRGIQSNPAISNSVNSKSPLFRRKIECPWIYPSPLRFPGYFEAPLFRTFFHFPWDFEIAGFDCIRGSIWAIWAVSLTCLLVCWLWLWSRLTLRASNYV